MDRPPHDPVAPASQRRGRLSSRPEDRATPVVDAATDYSAYIAASDAAMIQGRTTARIDVAVLDDLREQAQRTGMIKRPPELDQARYHTPSDPPVVPTRNLALPVLGAIAVLAAAALGLAVARGRVSTTAATPATAPVEPSAHATATPASTPIPVRAQPPHAEEQARAALERLRKGIGECVRRVRALPGSSPAVPATLASLKGGAYTAAPAEWRTAVWSCAHFQVEEAMEFQIQWQLLKRGVDGMGIAWIDADGDGVADGALGFHITFGPRGVPVLGEVAPIEPSHAVVPLR